MIRITPAAATQVRLAAEQSNSRDMPLRIAIALEKDGSFQYGMGFDEKKEDDVLLNSEGINIVVSNNCTEALMGATLDYVELNPGEFRFIFTNPNDPAHDAAGRKPGA
jgi:iron-sulfur cluster assembly protein